MTPIRDQGTCGSCYAFSGLAAVESNWWIKHSKDAGAKNEQLSVQHIMDCDISQNGNNGCFGGQPDFVFSYYVKWWPMTEASYPYEAVQKTCRSTTAGEKLIDTYGSTPAHTFADTYALLVKGPVSVLIGVSVWFSNYRYGIFDGTKCYLTPNHAVVLVGYGVDPTLNNQEYWLIRNSWGASFGEAGHIRISVGTGMECTVSLFGTQPLVN